MAEGAAVYGRHRYGDVSPSTAEARMITVVSIVVTFAIVPTQFTKLLHILELQVPHPPVPHPHLAPAAVC
jgi:hypothetical protein